MTDFLILSFIFLVAGVIAVPIASRLGLGSVLGYLIAGIVISPVLVSAGVDIVSIQHFAEFGVVMMLFLVGLELEPKMLWAMRSKLIGLGGLQVLLTGAAVALIAMWLGQPPTVSIAIGCVMALSSTAIVLQTLYEKGWMKSDGGQASFSVLLFQDIAVIPMLALLPLLAMPELMDMAGSGHGVETHAVEVAHSDAGHGTDSHAAEDDHSGGDHGGGIDLMSGLPGWAQALITLGAIGFVLFAGSYLTGPLFRFVSGAGLRELFIAAALMLVIGIAVLMTLVGLSPALGTFLAGVVLATSEYRHELESDIDPFKGLLLGLFFITVGAGVDFNLLAANLGNVLAMTVGLIVLKAVILLILARIFRVQGSDKWLFSLGLAQAGEFGFVLLSFTVGAQVIPSAIADQLLLVVALSMLLTPALFIAYDRLIAPRFNNTQNQEADDIDEKGNIIIAGHGRFGGIINRMLRINGYQTTVLDYSSSQLDMLKAFDVKAFFGDATRPDLLHAAGIEDATMLVIAIDDKDHITELARYVSENHPHVKIVARAIDRTHVYELYAAGCRQIIRETFDGAVRAGRSALEELGVTPYEAELRAQDFRDRDLEAMIGMAPHFDPEIPIHENQAFIEASKVFIARSEQEMSGTSSGVHSRATRGWNPPRVKLPEAEDDSTS